MLDLETGVIVNLHIKSIDQSEAIKTIKRKITDLDKMKIEEQKKKQLEAVTILTYSRPTLPLSGMKRRISCRIYRAATSECFC